MTSLKEIAINEDLAVYERVVPVVEIESDVDTDFSEDDGNPGDAIEVDPDDDEIESADNQHQEPAACPVEIKEEKIEPVSYNNSKYFKKKRFTAQTQNLVIPDPPAKVPPDSTISLEDRYFEVNKQEPEPDNPEYSRGRKRKRSDDTEVEGGEPRLQTRDSVLGGIKVEPRDEHELNMVEIKDEPGAEFEVDRKSLDKYNSIRTWKLTRLGEDLGPNGTRTIFANNVKFRILTYNILSPSSLHRRRNIFRNKKEFLLSWEYRFRGIQREINSIDPDIVCLQEVEFADSEEVSDELIEFFSSKGYVYRGLKREDPKTDGCAVFYKDEVFECEDVKLIDFRRKHIPHLSSSNVAVICRLKTRSNPLRLVVGTVHLRFGQTKNLSRLAQMAIFLADMTELANLKHYTVPCIIAGDFNFEPFTDVHKLLTKGYFAYRGLDSGEGRYPSSVFPRSFGLSDRLEWEPDVKDRHKRESNGSFRHDFGFRCAYQYREERALYLGFAPPESDVTAYQGNWVCVDNIFYSTVPSQWAYTSIDGRMEKKLKLLGKWSLPTASQISSLGGLPSMVSPSDHLPLAADFLLC